jgi:hypothetical protein
MVRPRHDGLLMAWHNQRVAIEVEERNLRILSWFVVRAWRVEEPDAGHAHQSLTSNPLSKIVAS